MKFLVVLCALVVAANAHVDGQTDEQAVADAGLKLAVDANVGASVDGALEGATAGLEGATGQVGQAGGILETGLGALGGVLQSGPGAIWSGLKGGKNFVQQIIDFIKGLVEGLVKFVLGILNAVTEQIDKLETKLFDQVGIQKIGGFRSTVNKLGSEIRKVGDSVIGGLSALGGELGSTLSGRTGGGGGSGLGVGANVGVGAGAHGGAGGHHRETSGVDPSERA